MTTVQDETDQQQAVDVDDAIVRAIGQELRRARTTAGWSRPELVSRMRSQVPVNTYACYEQGIRQCSIPRLYEICQALDVSVMELIGLALQRMELELERSGAQIDLHKVLQDDRPELQPLRQWARNRMNEDAHTADCDRPTVVRLPWVAIKEIAIFCGFSQRSLLEHIREFTPESVARA